MQYDVVIVGAGPAGLACAIRLKQLKPELERVRAGEGLRRRRALALRRGLEPGPLEALLPEWQDRVPAACRCRRRAMSSAC